ncbi:hypothetical protein V3564_06140 [Bartonella sp. B12(2025)]
MMLENADAHVFDAANQNTGWIEIGMFIVNWAAGIICIAIIAIFCTVGFIVSMLAQLGLFLVISLGPLFKGKSALLEITEKGAFKVPLKTP